MRKPEDLERFWKIVGLVLFLLAIILVAGPQLIDLFIPGFR